MIWSAALPCSDTDAEVKKIQIRRGFSTFAALKAPLRPGEVWCLNAGATANALLRNHVFEEAPEVGTAAPAMDHTIRLPRSGHQGFGQGRSNGISSSGIPALLKKSGPSSETGVAPQCKFI